PPEPGRREVLHVSLELLGAMDGPEVRRVPLPNEYRACVVPELLVDLCGEDGPAGPAALCGGGFEEEAVIVLEVGRREGAELSDSTAEQALDPEEQNRELPARPPALEPLEERL